MTESTHSDTNGGNSDGRRLRSVASRARISQAFISLVQDGRVTPTAHEVALRAEVGLRSVFRHFTDMDALFHEMAVHSEQLLARSLPPAQGRARSERELSDIIAERAEAFEKITPFQAAAATHQHASSVLREHRATFNKLQRSTLMRALPDQLGSDKELLEALDMALSFDTWQRLRKEQRLGKDRAMRVVMMTCEALLGGGAKARRPKS